MAGLIRKTALFSALMALAVFLICAVFGSWRSAAIGAAAGYVAALGNFLLLALTVKTAAGREKAAAKQLVRASFLLRMLVMGAAFLATQKWLEAAPFAFLLVLPAPAYAARLAGSKKWTSG